MLPKFYTDANFSLHQRSFCPYGKRNFYFWDNSLFFCVSTSSRWIKFLEICIVTSFHHKVSLHFSPLREGDAFAFSTTLFVSLHISLLSTIWTQLRTYYFADFITTFILNNSTTNSIRTYLGFSWGEGSVIFTGTDLTERPGEIAWRRHQPTLPLGMLFLHYFTTSPYDAYFKKYREKVKYLFSVMLVRSRFN